MHLKTAAIAALVWPPTSIAVSTAGTYLPCSGELSEEDQKKICAAIEQPEFKLITADEELVESLSDKQGIFADTIYGPIVRQAECALEQATDSLVYPVINAALFCGGSVEKFSHALTADLTKLQTTSLPRPRWNLGPEQELNLIRAAMMRRSRVDLHLV
ncbi:hypothetical protein BDV11DRAFT_170419 [Aspergillus similis]